MKELNSNAFTELTRDEAMSIDGGFEVIEASVGCAVAFVTICGAAFVGGFAAGRGFVRDVRAKWFHS